MNFFSLETNRFLGWTLWIVFPNTWTWFTTSEVDICVALRFHLSRSLSSLHFALSLTERFAPRLPRVITTIQIACSIMFSFFSFIQTWDVIMKLCFKQRAHGGTSSFLVVQKPKKTHFPVEMFLLQHSSQPSRLLSGHSIEQINYFFLHPPLVKILVSIALFSMIADECMMARTCWRRTCSRLPLQKASTKLTQRAF